MYFHDFIYITHLHATTVDKMEQVNLLLSILYSFRLDLTFYRISLQYRMAGNFGGKIFWRIAENMSFGRIYFGG